LKWRQEHKYAINESSRILLSSRLGYILDRDIHGSEDGVYVVRSLYFDDIENSALRDKLNGNPKRTKFRIRYYNGDASFIRLEKKTKNLSYGIKKSENISLEESEKIIRGEIDFLVESDKELLREFYTELKLNFLKPSVIIEYKREAFCLPYDNVRVTLDSDIKATRSFDCFFEKSLVLTDVSDDNKSVLEIKFDNIFPDYIREIISPHISSSEAFSKYAAGRKYY